MSKLTSPNTPTMPLQEVYDGKNHYVPSFFRIKLGVFADFMDTANIPFGSFAAFFHEYIHYIQDVTTLYGLMNLGNITYYVRDAAARVNALPLGYFSTPIELQQRSGDCGYDNYLVRKIYNGSSINPKYKEVDLINYSIKTANVAGHDIEYVEIIIKDKETKEEAVKQFGGHILTEGMAYICERLCNEMMFENNRVTYPIPSEYPYWINTLLAQKIYPDIAQKYTMLATIADISLLTYNCGLTYVRLLEYLKSMQFMKSVSSDNYLKSFDKLYELCQKYIHWSPDHFKLVQDNVLESVKNI